LAYTIPNTVTISEQAKQFKAQRYGLVIGLVGIAMVFAGFTSAFLVRRASGGWTTYQIPDVFWISTIIIVLSSLLLFAASYFINANKLSAYRLSLVGVFGLAITFLILQMQGWNTLKGMGIWIDGTPSGSFFYLISWFHAAHVFGGLFVLLYALAKSFFINNTIPLSIINSKQRQTLTSTYWHFVGGLWIYLFLFMVWYN
jgi:cytochrome c oxidase subunit 3